MKTALLAMLAMLAIGVSAGSPASAQTAPDSRGNASTQAGTPTPARSYHYWLHPKQGMVKVDKVTHFMVVPRRQKQAG